MATIKDYGVKLSLDARSLKTGAVDVQKVMSTMFKAITRDNKKAVKEIEKAWINASDNISKKQMDIAKEFEQTARKVQEAWKKAGDASEQEVRQIANEAGRLAQEARRASDEIQRLDTRRPRPIKLVNADVGRDLARNLKQGLKEAEKELKNASQRFKINPLQFDPAGIKNSLSDLRAVLKTNNQQLNAEIQSGMRALSSNNVKGYRS